MNKALFLKQVPLFSRLSRRDLDPVARIAQIREAEKGEVIFSQATPGDTLYVVVRGTIKIFSRSRTGRAKTFAYLEARDFFGEMALLEAGGRSADAVALSPAVLLTIRRKDFQAFLLRRPQLALALLRALCDRLRGADREIESLSFNSVVGRVAKVLLDLEKRYGRRGPGGTRIQLELSHRELADMVGTAREMVTRVLNRFIRTGCLKLEGKNLTITDVDKLRGWVY